ncbi:MAG: oxygenase MpaB family protein [Candidatus Binataceae bacterium]
MAENGPAFTANRPPEWKLPIRPGSILWDNLSDWRILLGGGRALVLQTAHPIVAAGVGEHSNFAADPWKRLWGTLEMYVGGVLFGWPGGSIAAAKRLRKLHERIKGTDTAGKPYDSLEPAVFHWVHATLVDGAVLIMRRFGIPLEGRQLDNFYAAMCEAGRMYGLRDSDMPPDWPRFRAYFDEMVRTTLEDNDVVRQVLDALQHAPRPPTISIPDFFWDWFIWPGVGHLGMLCTVGLLPPVLRERLEIQWSAAQEFELRLQAEIIRRTVPMLPAKLRMHPWAYAARYGTSPTHSNDGQT